MTPDIFLKRIINPGLVLIEEVGGPKPSHDARRMMLCIALQESGPSLNARYQNSPSSSPGPARGWWQFEQGGGVAGVLQHAASKAMAYEVCDRIDVVVQAAAVWRSIEGNDSLSSAFARLLLWTDPKALPTTEETGWNYYLNLWRPGKPHRTAWTPNWNTANQTLSKEA